MSLITKINSSVSNPNLLKLGDYVFDVNTGEAVFRSEIAIKSSGDTSRIKTEDGSVLFTCSSGDANYGAEVSGNDLDVYLGVETSKILIHSKYDYTYLKLRFPYVSKVDAVEFGFVEGRAEIDFYRCNLQKTSESLLWRKAKKVTLDQCSFNGNIDLFSENADIEGLVIRGDSSVVGDVSSLGKLIKSPSFNFENSPNVEGGYGDLFDALYQNGKVSGQVSTRLAQDSYNWKIAVFSSSGWTLDG